MSVTAIIGAQWGDEGKGRVVDLLAEDAELVIRCQGGANAGHTVVNPLGRFILHLIPSGIFNKNATCIIGSGVAMDPESLRKEMEDVKKGGVGVDRLLISDRAQVVMPYHILFDRLEEERLGANKVGTTLRGIGPCYGDKVARIGIQAGDLLEPDVLRKKIEAAVELKNRIINAVYNSKKIEAKHMLEWALEQGAVLRDHIMDTTPLTWDAIDAGKNVLLEGQLGTMRDIDWGAYPYITTSSTGAAGLCAGSGVPPTKVDRVIGVTKVYTTAVGNGPFPTELNDGMGDFLRNKGNEFGATTGRPRRTGWFDAVGVKFSVRLNGITDLALTKLDVLDEFESIKYATAYKQNGKTFNSVPLAPLQDIVEPVYEEMPGWKGTVSEARKFEDLPDQARNFVNRIEELVGVKASMISVGAERNQIIMR